MHRWKLALLTAGLLATTATGCAGGTSAPDPAARAAVPPTVPRATRNGPCTSRNSSSSGRA